MSWKLLEKETADSCSTCSYSQALSNLCICNCFLLGIEPIYIYIYIFIYISTSYNIVLSVFTSSEYISFLFLLYNTIKQFHIYILSIWSPWLLRTFRTPYDVIPKSRRDLVMSRCTSSFMKYNVLEWSRATAFYGPKMPSTSWKCIPRFFINNAWAIQHQW